MWIVGGGDWTGPGGVFTGGGDFTVGGDLTSNDVFFSATNEVMGSGEVGPLPAMEARGVLLSTRGAGERARAIAGDLPPLSTLVDFIIIGEGDLLRAACSWAVSKFSGVVARLFLPIV